MTGVLIAAGAALVGIGATLLGKRRKDRMTVPRRYDTTVAATLTDVEDSLNRRLPGRGWAVYAHAGTHRRGGYWYIKHPRIGDVCGWLEGMRVNVVTDPEGRMLGGPKSSLAHELSHGVLPQSMSADDQHKAMKDAGIWPGG